MPIGTVKETVNETKMSSIISVLPTVAPGVRVGMVTAAASLHYTLGVWNRLRTDKSAALSTILTEQVEKTAHTFGLSSNPILREALRTSTGGDRFVFKTLDNRLELMERQARAEK